MSKQEIWKSVILRSAATIALTSAFVSVAGTAPAATPAGASDSNATSVTELVVTAEKRAEPIQTIPDAVTAVTAQRLQSVNANGFADFYRLVPSLVVTPGSQGENTLSIRGVNSSVFTGPTVGIYIDDTPIGTSVAGDHANSLVPDVDPGDLQRIDVLRGPQGTLYGAANIGGLLKFVTTAPSLTSYSGRIEADASTVYNGGWGYVVRGGINGPIVTDKLGFSLSAYDREDPGFINDPGVINNTSTNQHLSQPPRNDINKTDTYGGRLAALWQVTDDVSLRVSAIYQHHHDGGQTAEDINGNTLQPLVGNLQQVASQFTGPDTVQLQVYNAALTWDLHWASLLSSTSYAINDFNSSTDITGLVPPSPTSGFPPAQPAFLFPNAGAGYFTFPSLPASYYSPVDLAYQTRKITEELRLTSPSSDRLEWQAGFFYTHEDTRGSQQITLNDPATGIPYTVTGICAPPFPVPSPAPGHPLLPACLAINHPAPAGTPFHHSTSMIGYTEYAGYGDVTYHLTQAFSVEAGLRYSTNQNRFTGAYQGVLDSLSTGVFSGGASGSFNGSDVTYLVSPKYQLTKDVMFYGRFATGYRPGGANVDIPGTPPTFGPDTTTNYELGAKTAFADGRLVVDVAAFLIDWDHVQLHTTNSSDFFYFLNGGKAQSEGFEVEAEARPIQGLSIRANGSYDHAVLTQDIPGSAGVAGFRGDRMPYSPEWSGDLSADYSFPIVEDWMGRVGGDVQYVGDVLNDFYPCTGSPPSCTNLANLPPARTRLPAYTIANLRAGLTKGPWTLNVFVKNVANKLAFTEVSVQHATYGLTVPNGKEIPDSASMITPRTIGFSVSRTF